MPTPLRVVVCGASGRMGGQVAALARSDPRFALACEIHRFTPRRELASLIARGDALVDFTTAAASVAMAAAAAEAELPIVIGTTGFSAPQRAAIEKLARRVPIFLAPNFSVGVHVLGLLAAQAARALASWDAAISETHHKAKTDAPSGTALRLATLVEAERGGAKAPCVSLRVGDVVGEHTLTLAGPFERLELTHRAHSRAVFARGALEAALWLSRRKPGLYGMDDMLDAR